MRGTRPRCSFTSTRRSRACVRRLVLRHLSSSAPSPFFFCNFRFSARRNETVLPSTPCSVGTRDCRTLWPGHLRQRRRKHPRRQGLRSPWGAVRLVPASSLSPSHPLSVVVQPSPAPWLQSCARDGATPEAGVPAALRRLRVQPWPTARVSQQSNAGRDGATLGAGDPCDVRPTSLPSPPTMDIAGRQCTQQNEPQHKDRSGLTCMALVVVRTR